MLRIKDIALEANVSEGTVDRVLHNRGGVSKKTEAKIKKILEERNFIQNPVASALAMQTNFSIAVLIPEFTDEDIFWKSPYFGILKASNEVKNTGIGVDFYSFNPSKPSSYTDTVATLIDAKPSAVLLVPFFIEKTKRILEQLNQLNITCYFLNIEPIGFDDVCFIGQDAYKAGFIAGKLMNLSIPENTSTLIIITKNQVKNQTISSRIEGYKNYFSENNSHNSISKLIINNFTDIAANEKTIATFLEKNKSIKGLFVPSSRISLIVKCLSKESLQDLKLIGFDNTDKNIELLIEDSIAFLISQKPFEQGYEAIRLIADQLKFKKNIPNKIYLPIDILIKENVTYHDLNQKLFEKENYLPT
jgi:LacI family transcriptional regulator